MNAAKLHSLEKSRYCEFIARHAVQMDVHPAISESQCFITKYPPTMKTAEEMGIQDVITLLISLPKLCVTL